MNLVADRPVLPGEHWLVQGFPHHIYPALPTHLAKYFPAGIDEGLTDTEMKSLTGNSMHIAQVGSWLLFSLGCTTRFM